MWPDADAQKSCQSHRVSTHQPFYGLCKGVGIWRAKGGLSVSRRKTVANTCHDTLEPNSTLRERNLDTVFEVAALCSQYHYP